jgi:hypoxanthine phosphoribosyltransferase
MENKLSWEQVAELSQKLARTVEQSGFKPDYLIGVTVGGLIPLGLLAEELDIRNIVTISANSYDKREQKEITVTYLPDIDLAGKKLLLIDEVSETGKTLQHLTSLLKEKYGPGELRTAVLVLNKKESLFRPDYFSRETEEWLVFPWEKEE